MVYQSIKAKLQEENPEALFVDGFDGALIGIAYRCGQSLAVYSIEKCLEILKENGVNEEEAVEHFWFNVAGSWMGENTPLFLETF